MSSGWPGPRWPEPGQRRESQARTRSGAGPVRHSFPTGTPLPGAVLWVELTYRSMTRRLAVDACCPSSTLQGPAGPPRCRQLTSRRAEPTVLALECESVRRRKCRRRDGGRQSGHGRRSSCQRGNDKATAGRCSRAKAILQVFTHRCQAFVVHTAPVCSGRGVVGAEAGFKPAIFPVGEGRSTRRAIRALPMWGSIRWQYRSWPRHLYGVLAGAPWHWRHVRQG